MITWDSSRFLGSLVGGDSAGTDWLWSFWSRCFGLEGRDSFSATRRDDWYRCLCWILARVRVLMRKAFPWSCWTLVIFSSARPCQRISCFPWFSPFCCLLSIRGQKNWAFLESIPWFSPTRPRITFFLVTNLAGLLFWRERLGRFSCVEDELRSSFGWFGAPLGWLPWSFARPMCVFIEKKSTCWFGWGWQLWLQAANLREVFLHECAVPSQSPRGKTSCFPRTSSDKRHKKTGKSVYVPLHCISPPLVAKSWFLKSLLPSLVLQNIVKRYRCSFILFFRPNYLN